jgi:hypothetical protein
MAGMLTVSTISRGEEEKSIATHTETIHVPLQQWQERHIEFAKIVQGLRSKDTDSAKKLDNILYEYDEHTFSRTPIESLDIIALYHFQKEGMEICLPLIVAHVVLGWYDALRFGSESGRSEILWNQKFYKRFTIFSQKEQIDSVLKFLSDNPEKVRERVELGLKIAENYKNTVSYDRHWPSAFGLERLICAQGGPCEEIKPLPRDKWDAAWEEAKQRARVYYQINEQNDSVAKTQPGK